MKPKNNTQPGGRLPLAMPGCPLRQSVDHDTVSLANEVAPPTVGHTRDETECGTQSWPHTVLLSRLRKQIVPFLDPLAPFYPATTGRGSKP